MDVIISGPIYNVTKVTDRNDETFYQFTVLEKLGKLTIFPVVKVPIKSLGDNKFVKDILRNLAKMHENNEKLEVPVSVYVVGQPQATEILTTQEIEDGVTKGSKEMKDRKWGVYTDKGGAIYVTVWNPYNIKIVGMGSYTYKPDGDGDFDEVEYSEERTTKNSSKKNVVDYDDSEISDEQLEEIKKKSSKTHIPEEDIPF